MKQAIDFTWKCITLFAVIHSPTFAVDLPSNISSYLQDRALTEELLLPSLDGAGKVFAEYVVTNRAQILNAFTTVAPTARKQKLLLAAMEFSGANDYLSVLNKVCDFKAANSIESDVFKAAITATPVRKGFLSYNYQNASVRALIQRAQTLLPNDATFQDYLTALLDGSQKAIDARYFKVEELPVPELLPP